MDQKVYLLILEGREQEMCGESRELAGWGQVMDKVSTFGEAEGPLNIRCRKFPCRVSWGGLRLTVNPNVNP